MVHYFSSSSRYRQNALAEDLGAEDISEVNREFTKFSELGETGVIDRKIVDTLVNKMNIHTMTEVQRMTINECLDGSDVIAQARTGTGKTLAFLMPIVQRLLKHDDLRKRPATIDDIRALIISPTRELAEQIAAEAKKITYGTNVQVQTAVGGTQKGYHLKLMQRAGCHILVGTPGRVKDLLSDQYSGVRLHNIDTFVLDEADRLLDIGFAPDIAEIQSYMPPLKSRDRQTLMFSATMPRSVVGLVRQTMKPDFKFVRTVDPDDAATHESVPQRVVFLPGLQNQLPVITEIAVKAIEAHKRDPANNPPFKAIVFFSCLNEVKLAYQVLQNLRDRGASRGRFFGPHPLAPCKILEMSSQLSQRSRTSNSQAFRNAESAMLVSSDVAARGMDFPNVTHVIQVGMPKSIEDYVHRLGRTGRAGKSGQGWLLLPNEDRSEWRKLIRSIHAHNISEDNTLETGRLDMTQPCTLTPETGKIMQMVESGVRSVSIQDKAAAYMTIISYMAGQGRGMRSKQDNVDMVNDLSKYGWGLERPPSVPASFVSKLGLQNVEGLEVRDAPVSNFSRDRRRANSLGGYSERDPFGQGFSGGKGTFQTSRSIRRDDFSRERPSEW
ncbi:uncharacterized protein Z518_06953 [Rhinocladiella mackenziei CBS 650.93]|uniref:ATP-dependent RNA helicase n=1 Tax=Rhinocladiella mackenziei CBS 650.93 TaxID=1442369 RepID=A0A0D2IJH3_9EURO|nr:uncharacterized protein Z518_06953 [Rhinocladiella mackenziei CBS 650.93]KIX03401.1 hypothetical protein Z518_06953 [Rhinocladiella mackenziei CBS 650.93]